MTNAPTNEMLARLDASQKACFDAGQHIAAMDIQDARAYIARLAATPSARDVLAHTPTSNSDVAEALTQAFEYFDNHADVVDGDYGVPEPNREMRLAQMCEEALSNLDAAAPAAEPAAWQYKRADGEWCDWGSRPDRTEFAKEPERWRPLYAAPPLQAPAFDLPKRPFAFAVRRAPENGPDQWRLFMDEGEARAEAEQLDGDYEALFRVGDRRSAIAALQAPAHSDAVRDMLPTQEYVLRAMVKNYADGNLWDHLDREVCTKAADEIKSLRTALTAPAAKAPAVSEADVDETYRIDHDGFEGVKIGTYTTLEGKRGVVLQQVGTRVVHVYGEKWLKPIQSAAQGGRTEGGEA